MDKNLIFYILTPVLALAIFFGIQHPQAEAELRRERDLERIYQLNLVTKVLDGISDCAEGRPFLGSKEKLALGKSFEDGQRLDDGWVKIKPECLGRAAPELSVLLMDPLDNEHYHFQFLSNGKNFLLRARLENRTDDFYSLGDLTLQNLVVDK